MIYEAKINSNYTVRSDESKETLKRQNIQFVFSNGSMTCIMKTENMNYEEGVGGFFNGTYTDNFFKCKVVESEEVNIIKGLLKLVEETYDELKTNWELESQDEYVNAQAYIKNNCS